MEENGVGTGTVTAETMKDMTADDAVRMVRELCAQLHEEPESFHGNIWPGNIRTDWEGKAVLGTSSDAPAGSRTAEQVEYLSPEFFWDGSGSAASDVYSLGMLLYAGCSGGYLPFQPRGGLMTNKDRSGALRKRMKGEPIPAPSGVSSELGSVIRKALAYEPEDRYLSAAELLRALGETDEALPAPEKAAAEASAPELPAEEPQEAPAEAPAEQPAEEPAAAEAAPIVLSWSKKKAAPAAAPAPAPETAENAAAEEIPAEEPAEEPEEEPATEPEEELRIPAEEIPAEAAPAAEPAPGGAEEREPTVSDILFEKLSAPPEVPAEETPADEEAVPRRYTVDKDFEKRSAGRTTVPAANRKKKKTGSVILAVLCVAAAAAIGAAVLWKYLPFGQETDTRAKTDTDTTTHTIETVLTTQPPSPVEVTPSIGDDDETGTAEETDAASEEAGPAEGAPVGSAYIDGMAVEPAGDIVMIADTGANLRTGPGTNYAIAESLPRGAELTRTGTVNGWSQVQYQGGEYYVATNLLTEKDGAVQEPAVSMTSAAAAADGDAVGTLVVASDVNIRSGPGTEYDKVGEAKTGAVLSAVGRSSDGKWYLVSTESGTGYVNRKLVTVRDYAEITAQSGTLTVTGDVNLRAGPAVGYDKIGEAKTGAELRLTGATDTGWYRVEYEGKTAYLAGNYAAVKS